MVDPALTPLLALVILVGTYLGLAVGGIPGLRVDRTGVAIIGATATVVSGVLSWDRAVAAVDAHTLVLLFGMMIVAAYLRLSGFFHVVSAWAVRGARTPVGLLGAIVAASGVLSALFVNDVVCVVLAPQILQITRRLRLPPAPYLIALATAANVGSVATLTGNPQNMLIGSFSGITYRAFLLREAPVALLGLACVFVAVWLAYRRRLPERLETTPLEHVAVHHALMAKTLVVVGAMVTAFLAGVPIAVVAIGGAAYLLLSKRTNPARVYAEIDWGLLVLFTGLFVVVGGAEQTRLIEELFAWAGGVVDLHRPAALVTATALLSNLVSNVPAVLFLKPLVAMAGEPTRAWVLVATAATLAGNLTVIGSVANVIVVEIARREHTDIGFWEYARVGVPLTLVTLFLGWLTLVSLRV